jgi:hypothetical protein
MMDFESEIVKVLADSKVWDGTQPFFTTATNDCTAAAAPTLDELAKLADEIDKLRPPPPDKSRCENCKEPMHHDGHPIYAGFGGPACYVCGRCYYLFRQWARSRC